MAGEHEASLETTLDNAVRALANARRLLVITGAGMSAESGLPTYRGVGGLYNHNETVEGLPIEQALSGPVFRSRPEVTWKYLIEIERHARGATFHRGHQILADLESKFDALWILTQNIDGFHTAAGSRDVVEIHGNLYRLSCCQCGRRWRVNDYAGLNVPPACDACGGLVRPQVVLFEEMLPSEALTRLESWLDTGYDAVMSIGTSSHFPYIIQPILSACRQGIPSIEINPAPTALSEQVDFYLPLPAGQALQALWDRWPDVTDDGESVA